MDQHTFNKILALNKDFYKKVAEEFDVTRQYPWKGWNKISRLINQSFTKTEIKILDLGCGNARFLDFLRKNTGYTINYTGIDNNKTLLKIAREKFPDQNFINSDIISFLPDVKNEFDVITVFGLTHHIPAAEHRKKWFQDIAKLSAAQSAIVISFWQIDKDPRFKPLDSTELEIFYNIEKTDLDEGDYFIGWGTSKNVHRYVHIFTQQELHIIRDIFNQIGFYMACEFEDEGHHQTLNKYQIYKNFI